MPTLVEGLLLGSARVDTMRAEINSVTKMLFGLAKHPNAFIRSYEFEGIWSNFHVQYGTLEKDGCQWDVWWEKSEFCTRCLVYRNETEAERIVCAFGNPVCMPHQSRKSFEPQQKEYGHLRVAGVARAHACLEVFVRGMLHDFPITYKVMPFLDAAGVSL